MAEKVYEMFTEYNDVVTVEEVMEMLHLGRVTVYNLLKTDKIHTLSAHLLNESPLCYPLYTAGFSSKRKVRKNEYRNVYRIR